jgi:hypothetical protein
MEDGFMGEIIPFRAAHRRRVPIEPQGPAQILFFLGVRYCREDAELDMRTSGRSGLTRSRQK